MTPDCITLQCDSCDWRAEQDIYTAPEWHGVACPKCGVAPILSDEDMNVLRGILALSHAGLVRVESGPSSIVLDTRPLRAAP